MHYAISVKNNNCMCYMKCTIPGHGMPPCFFSNSFLWSACSVTNSLTSLTDPKPSGFRKSCSTFVNTRISYTVLQSKSSNLHNADYHKIHWHERLMSYIALTMAHEQEQLPESYP